jgi:hypothetical protein
MRESDNEILARAYETLEQANRTLDQQQRDPVAGDEPMPIADWRGCGSTQAMNGPQFDQYCRDGMPPLTPPIVAPVAMVPKAKVDELVARAIDQERANTQAAIEAAVAIVGEECGKNEGRLRADFEAKLDALRAEISKHHVVGDDVLDLPDWRSHHVEH